MSEAGTELNGAEMIAQERRMQEVREGYDARHDDGHVSKELLQAAECYAWAASNDGVRTADEVKGLLTLPRHGLSYLHAPTWPVDWEPDGFKPTEDVVVNLVKAGALLAAEIDRVLRLRERESRRGAEAQS